jgi:regulator of protease activity HflC (stomatin/prohibitin superfamily)
MKNMFDEKNKQFLGIVLGATFVVVLIFSGKLFEDVEADEIVINQVPITGKLEFWTTPGMKFQAFGDIQVFDKSFQIWFSSKKDQGGSKDESIKIMFNDAGEATLSGSARLLMPKGSEKLKMIKMDFGNFQNLIHELIRPTLAKVVFSTGPLMSSYEAYAVKKNDLIRFIEDQLRYGIYKTLTKEVKVKDELSGKEKTVSVAELITDKDAPGGFVRQEVAPLTKYGIDIRAVAIEDIDFEEKIRNQISQQQKALMDVQTSIAEAKKAKQDAIKAEEQGKADYAKAKWEQEKINAKEIAEAEKAKQVAKLDMEKARFQKQADILAGQGIATKKKLIMQADGALDKKLKAQIEIQKLWAEAFSKFEGPLVPSIVMGSGDTGSMKYKNSAQAFMDMMLMKSAKDLGVDMKARAE